MWKNHIIRLYVIFMGRELKRKQAKKNGQNVRDFSKNDNDSEMSMKKLLIILGVVVLIAIILYLFIGIVVTKEIDWFSNGNDNEVINKPSNSILASAIFRQTEEEYYVYFYDFDESNTSIDSYISGISDKIYRVDTGDALNSNYVSDTTNKDAKTLDDLKVKSPTIVKIVNDQITEYYEGEEAILTIEVSDED